jgi:Zn-dependent metalloprotease
LILAVLSIIPAMAQQSQRLANASTPNTGAVHWGKPNEAPRAILFNPGTVTPAQFLSNINTYLNTPGEFTFSEVESNTDQLGMRHRLLQQYYKGLPLEGMTYRVHEKAGFVTSANGRAVKEINLDMRVMLTEAQAFQRALQYTHTQHNTVMPGKKLIVSKNFTYAPESFFIAFQYDIDVTLVERWRVSIDARTGELINQVSLVNTCGHNTEPLLPGTGTGTSSYYGTRTIRVDQSGTSSTMQGQTEHGGRISTYDFKNNPLIVLQLGIPVSTPVFYSSNNVYNSVYQRPAVSAQWAAEQAYEYYFKKHNRNSFDNNGGMIKCYVHLDKALNNAFWTGKVLAFGDGSNNNPLVELDVIGHEFTHGVTQYEAGLSYSYESGALNESFSDIMAKAIEFDTFGDTATWQVGRHHTSGGLRDFSNPNSKGQPDTYAGDLWYTGTGDSGGVHYNSGVQNFWFYLLCKGGSGVNDRGESYAINAIGIEAATRIAYRNLTEYLGSSSSYLDARIGALLAAADLYGSNSATYREVDKAWDAVGVIDEPIITSLEVYDVTATTVKIRGSLLPRGNTVNYHFEYGITPALGNASPTYPYTGTVEGALNGLQSQTKYYLRLVATNENGTSYVSTTFTTPSLAPMVNIKNTVDVTETAATLYGQVNPNSLPTSFYFEYGTTPAMGLITPSYQLQAATEYLNVSAPVTNLQPRRTYYYKLIATNGFATTPSGSASFFTDVKPIILSFLPTSAPLDTEVTITGQNFNTTAAKNIVSFGATRATALSSTSTEIRVKVPAGASFGTITVLNTESGLSAESAMEFVPTYTGEFKKGALMLTLGTKDYVYQALIQDMDGDNRPEIIALQGSGFSVFININPGGADVNDLSFVRNNFVTPYRLEKFFLFDFDGNGLKDIIARYQNTIRIYPNLSVAGFIFFGTPVDLNLSNFRDFTCNDFDQDGRIDIAVGYYKSGVSNLNILRNQNPRGVLLAENFVERFSMPAPAYIEEITNADLNNDGKPELIFDTSQPGSAPILKNNSYAGVFDFVDNTAQDIGTTRFSQHLVQDLNQDGWKDIVSYYSNAEGGNVSIAKNRGTAPAIALEKTAFALTYYPLAVVQRGDVDGDGKVDLITGITRGKFTFLKNKISAGQAITTASFESIETYQVPLASNENSRQMSIAINDLNGDGKPEIINTNSYNTNIVNGYYLEIWQNAPNECPDPSVVGVTTKNFSATLQLPPNTTLNDYSVEYAQTGSTYWLQVNSTTINGLSAGQTYQLRVRARCYTGYSNYYYTTFTIECINSWGFTISNIGVNSAYATGIYEVSRLEIQYSPAGEEQWITQPQSSTQLQNLLPGTTYDVRFRGRCPNPADFQHLQFTTLCPALKSLSVSDLAYNKATVNWASDYPNNAVTLEYKDDNGTWIALDKSGTMSALIPGKQYTVRGRMNCTNAVSDFIQTTFTTPCPKLQALFSDLVTPFSARVNWTDESNTGSYTVMYSLTPGGPLTSTKTNDAYFNLYDLKPGTSYTLQVAASCTAIPAFTSFSFNTVCYEPFNLAANDITHTTAEISWDAPFSILPYTVEYALAGSNAWQTFHTALNTLSLKGLRPGTEYEARVHITCPAVKPEPYASLTFETALYDATKFYPNPTDGETTIHPSKNLIGNAYTLYDNMGRNVGNGTLMDYTFDLSSFSPGLYTLKIEGESVMRIIKR